MCSLPVTAFLGFLAVVSLIIYVYLSWNNKYWTKRCVNGPRPRLLCGTFPKSAKGECNFIEELHEIYLRYKNSHRYVGVFVARSPKLFILDPKLAAEILTQHFSSFRDNESSLWTSPTVEKLRLCSPFVTTGDAWKDRRTELTAALTLNRLRVFYPSLHQCALKLVRHIEEQQHLTLNAKELTNRFTAEFMADFIWGIEANAFAAADSSSSPILSMGKAMVEQATNCVKYYGRTSIFPYLRHIYPVPFFPHAADNFFLRLATDAMQMRQASENEERYDVINHLLQLRDKKSISDIQIAGHTTTALIDGFETVAIVIAHSLWLLAREPRVQQKLRAELQASDETLTYDELNELPYLEQCVQETLRLFPPLTTLFKLCTSPIDIKDNDGTVLSLKPNDVIYISSYSFHQDADYYERPTEFWPERFDAALGGVRKYHDMGVFLPFGDGPRICAGMKLGLAEAKAAIAEVVKNFYIKCSPSMRKDNKLQVDCFLLTVDGGIELIFEKF